eukprot:12069871-Alexandrium_andersonii.AAC.1
MPDKRAGSEVGDAVMDGRGRQRGHGQRSRAHMLDQLNIQTAHWLKLSSGLHSIWVRLRPSRPHKAKRL